MRRMKIIPIGTIRTPFKKPEYCPPQGAFSNARGKILLKKKYKEALADLDGFSHAWLIFCFHKCGKFESKVKPLLDEEPRGLFATRHPNRPNPIGMTPVKILKINGCEIEFEGADMLDGSPLLDIKPLVEEFDVRAGAKTGWIERVLKRKRFSQKDIQSKKYKDRNSTQ